MTENVAVVTRDRWHVSSDGFLSLILVVKLGCNGRMQWCLHRDKNRQRTEMKTAMNLNSNQTKNKKQLTNKKMQQITNKSKQQTTSKNHWTNVVWRQSWGWMCWSAVASFWWWSVVVVYDNAMMTIWFRCCYWWRDDDSALDVMMGWCGATLSFFGDCNGHDGVCGSK